MKKYFLSIVALAGMLFATSCQESLVEPQMEGPTTFTVQVPDAMGTKAIGEASSVNKLFVEVYSNGTSIFKKTQYINGSTTVSLDLIKGQTYQIVFWAQKGDSYVKEGDGLAEINIPTEFHNNESGAAFYAYETFKIDGNAKTVTLRRPFAQLNLGTTALSLDTDASDADVQLISSSVTLETATKFSTIFGAGINVDTRTYAASISSFGDEKLTLANGDEYVYVSMDYLPVVYGGDVVELGVVIETNLGTITHNFTNVPIQKNYRTNIVGNLISSKTDFVVEVEDEWAGEENYNAEWGNLLSAAKNGGTLTLSADVVVPETIIIEKDLTLNLNGKTIKNELGTKASAVGTDLIIVNEGATLTIEGDGTIEAVSGNDGYAIIADGRVIINGGTIKSGIDQNNEPNAVVYARKNGKVYVNGGQFPNEHNSKFVLNKKDAHRATTTIEVRGGKFYNFNPQNNAAEGDNTNFVAEAEGYRVYEKDGWYEVYLDTNIVNLYNAASNGGEVTLTDDVTLTSPLIIKKSVKLNLGDKTITGGKDYVQGLTGIDIAAITVDGGNLIIEGEGSIIGSEYGVYAKNGGTLTVKGGELKGKTSAIQIAEAQVNIEGGKFSNTDDSDRRYVINCLDANWKDNTAKVNITGGSFYMFDPSNNAAEGTGTNFLTNEYSSLPNGDWFDVVIGASSKQQLLDLLSDPNISEINLASNIDMGSGDAGRAIEIDRDLIFNMNNKELKVKTTKANYFAYGFIVNGTKNVEFNDAKINGDGMYIVSGANVVYNGGEYFLSASETARYTFYVATNNQLTTLTINDGEFSIDLVNRSRVSYICSAGNSIVYINGGHFGEPSTEINSYPPFRVMNGGKIILSGGTFKFNPITYGATLAEGYEISKNAGVWTVVRK